jgi:cation diffusion facilitator family transporter
MTAFLIRLFIKNHQNTEDLTIREHYGFLSNTVGILCNLALFAAKFAIGTWSGSISIIADAFNSLSDMSSCTVSLIGFKISNMPPDKEHPFGHGRMEYLSGLIIAFIIILVGLECAKSAVQKILQPDVVTFNYAILTVLLLSILVKFWMSRFYKRISVLIRSVAVKASSKDSLNDAFITGAALTSVILSTLSPVPVDGYIGLGVALFILYSGAGMAKEILDPLLGQPPDPALVQEIEKILLSSEGVIGVHDLIVHNYGPGRIIASAHAEVPADSDFVKIHDTIDLAEREISRKLRIHFVIHMDPIDTNDAYTRELFGVTQATVAQIDPALSIHDFRIVRGETHVNLIFDVAVPNAFGTTNKKLREDIDARLKAVDPHYFAVVTIDRGFGLVN